MNPCNSMPAVSVTPVHVDRALKAMVEDCPKEKPELMTLEAVMLGAAIVAFMEAFEKQSATRMMLISILYSMLGDDLPTWVVKSFGFVHPSDWLLEDAKHEREERRLARLVKAKATREAKRAAEIEAEVQKRLAMVA